MKNKEDAAGGDGGDSGDSAPKLEA